MATALFIIVVVLSAIYIVVTSVTDDKRVYESLSKKQLYKLSIIKDVISSIIILLLIILPFIG
jgi:ABC-type Fe3+ transport system permease subunit